MAFDQHPDPGSTRHVAQPDPTDSCDTSACGASALVWADFTVGQLAFCGHHWDQVADAAGPAVLRITDRRREPLLPAG